MDLEKPISMEFENINKALIRAKEWMLSDQKLIAVVIKNNEFVVTLERPS